MKHLYNYILRSLIILVNIINCTLRQDNISKWKMKKCKMIISCTASKDHSILFCWIMLNGNCLRIRTNCSRFFNKPSYRVDSLLTWRYISTEHSLGFSYPRRWLFVCFRNWVKSFCCRIYKVLLFRKRSLWIKKAFFSLWAFKHWNTFNNLKTEFEYIRHKYLSL